MTFDIRHITRMLVVDTCSVWNLLSARKLYSAVRSAGLTMCITPAVLYECFFKARKSPNAGLDELTERLKAARSNDGFPIQECKLADLMVVAEAAPLKLSSGELSCIAVAYGIRSLAVMTDDRRARIFAEEKLKLIVETTPRLYGKLHFHLYLSDADHLQIIAEHEQFEHRPLSVFLQQMYERALQERLR